MIVVVLVVKAENVKMDMNNPWIKLLHLKNQSINQFICVHQIQEGLDPLDIEHVNVIQDYTCKSLYVHKKHTSLG